jgi:hypothetical protein
MMNRRNLIAAAVAACVVATLWWTRSHDSSSASDRRASETVSRDGNLSDVVAKASRTAALPTIPQAGSSAPPAYRVYETQEVDPVKDRAMRAEQELQYRIYRLRFLLAEAAAPCYQGPTSKEQISIGYTVIVENDELRLENVKVRETSIRDSAVQECLLRAVRDLRSLAPNIGKLRQDNEIWLSLADLADSNRRVDRSNTP